jgi:hypothetical protein
VSDWHEWQSIDTQSWRCGYCGRDVSSDRGWYAGHYRESQYETVTAYLAICPRCDLPSLITADGEMTVPPGLYGDAVQHLSVDVEALYDEARRAVGSGAHNSAALACRKILMHVGVEKGAPENENFVAYVNYLASKGYVPPDAREWIDEIREHGNDANHDIDLITKGEAENMVDFTAMLLRVIYEYPARGRQARADRRRRRP